MKNYRKEFEELKVVSTELASMARVQAIQKASTTDSYNLCVKRMFVLGCFSTDDQCGKELFIDDLR
jgi:hypothetical protein